MSAGPVLGEEVAVRIAAVIGFIVVLAFAIIYSGILWSHELFGRP